MYSYCCVYIFLLLCMFCSVLSILFHCAVLCTVCVCRSQWPRGLRRRSTAARLLRSWVRIPPGAWMFVCCECSVLSGRGLCDELITRPEESCRLWRVVVCDLETSRMRRPWPALGRSATRKRNVSCVNVCCTTATVSIQLQLNICQYLTRVVRLYFAN